MSEVQMHGRFTLKASRAARLSRHRGMPANTQDFEDVLAREDCYLCGVRVEFSLRSIDHIQPFSLGGTSDLSNLGMCCRGCNSEKKDKTLEEYRRDKFITSRGEKCCKRCRVELPLDHFGKHDSTLDRKRVYCKVCDRARARDNYWRNK